MCGRKTGRLLQQLDSNPTAMRSIVPLAHSQHSGGATEVVNWYELHPPRTKIWISWDQVLTTLPAANKREAASPACRINVCKLWAAGICLRPLNRYVLATIDASAFSINRSRKSSLRDLGNLFSSVDQAL
jgi:hypothetical protein